MRGSVLRQTIAWTAEGQRFKTKAAGVAAGFSSDQLQPLHEANWTVLFRAADPATGRKRQISKGGYRTRREAEVALRKAISAIDAGLYTRPTSLTVREFVEGSWLPGLESGDLRASTVAMYKGSATKYVLPHLGGQRLRDVTPVVLKAWLDGLKAAGVGDRTCEIAGVTCHKLLKAALDLELISRNPADNSAVREARPKSKAAPPVIWDAEQLRIFLNSQREDRLFPLWWLATMTVLGVESWLASDGATWTSTPDSSMCDRPSWSLATTLSSRSRRRRSPGAPLGSTRRRLLRFASTGLAKPRNCSRSVSSAATMGTCSSGRMAGHITPSSSRRCSPPEQRLRAFRS